MKSRNYWTEEVCRQEASKYLSRSDFMKECNGAYQKAHKSGWLDNICDHMERKNKVSNYWSYDKCKEVALMYENKVIMQEKEPYCFSLIYTKGWDKELFSHMTVLKKGNNYWTKEVCIEESLKYNNKRDFKKESSTALGVMRRNGWLSEVKHFEVLGNLYSRYVYSIEFSDKSVYVGLSYDTHKRLRQHLCNKCTVSKHIGEHKNLTYVLKILTDNPLEVSEAQEKERFWITQYRKLKWNVLNKVKGGAIGSKTLKWTIPNLRREALKYNSIADFRKHSSSAYTTAKRLKIIDEICSHMLRKNKKPSGYYTFEKCSELALCCSTKKELYTLYRTAYRKAHSMGWIDDITKHMGKDERHTQTQKQR